MYIRMYVYKHLSYWYVQQCILSAMFLQIHDIVNTEKALANKTNMNQLKYLVSRVVKWMNNFCRVLLRTYFIMFISTKTQNVLPIP